MDTIVSFLGQPVEATIPLWLYAIAVVAWLAFFYQLGGLVWALWRTARPAGDKRLRAELTAEYHLGWLAGYEWARKLYRPADPADDFVRAMEKAPDNNENTVSINGDAPSDKRYPGEVEDLLGD